MSELVSITFPKTDGWNRLHIFAMTLVPSDLDDFMFLHFRNIKLTTKWRTINGTRAYAVEATMGSYLPAALAPATHFWIDMPWFVIIQAKDLHTVEMGQYSRSMPGDQIVVNVWVAPGEGPDDGPGPGGQDTYQILRRSCESGTVSVTARFAGMEKGGVSQEDVKIQVESDELLRDTPEWFENGKFGIFMHWGVYAVPGWARVCVSIISAVHLSRF